jgi:hypothetical protein
MQLGTATLMYVTQSLNASIVQPGQVHVPLYGSFLHLFVQVKAVAKRTTAAEIADSNSRRHSQIMTQLGTAIRMYMPQSLNASIVQPGQVHFDGSWLRVCITTQLTISVRLVACTASHAMAAPSSPMPNLQHRPGAEIRGSACGSESVQCLTVHQR